jgi:hypothetical protein
VRVVVAEQARPLLERRVRFVRVGFVHCDTTAP